MSDAALPLDFEESIVRTVNTLDEHSENARIQLLALGVLIVGTCIKKNHEAIIQAYFDKAIEIFGRTEAEKVGIVGLTIGHLIQQQSESAAREGVVVKNMSAPNIG